MNRKRILLIVLAVVVIAAIAAVVATTVRGAAQSPPAAEEAAMRSAITTYELELEPFVPAKFYGRQLTIGPCITMLKTHVQRLHAVATGEGIWPTDIGWLYLAGIKRQVYELHGALPVSWSGRTASWLVVEGSGDRYVVRAAVRKTMHSATWDPAKKRLVRPGSISYTASTNEYMLERIDGTWKITHVVRNIDGSA